MITRFSFRSFFKKSFSRRRSRCYGFLFFLSSLLVFIFANKGNAQEYIFNRLASKDGLESNFVNAIWQDAKGFLWIGTKNGLQRFDGYHFISPYYSKTNPLPRLGVDQILGDRKGRMWVRMQYKVFIFDPSTFQCTPVPVHVSGDFPYGKDMVLDQDSRGQVYVVIRYHTWLGYDEKKNSFEQHAVPFRIPEGYRITRMLDDRKNGLFWVGTDNGLLAYDEKTNSIYSKTNNAIHHPLLQKEEFKNIITLFKDSKRRFWVGIWNPDQLFYCYDENKGQFTTDSAGITQSSRGAYYETEDFKELSNKVIMVYGRKLLAMNDRGYFESFIDDFQSNYSIDYGKVNFIYQDWENIVWIATDNGLYNTMAALHTSRHFMLSKKQPFTTLTNIHEMPNGDLWMGTWGRGIIKRSANLWEEGSTNWKETPPKDDNFQMVWSFCRQQTTGNLWIGCQHGRLIIYNNNKATYLNPQPFDNRTVRHIVQDRQGNLWMGLNGGKIFKWTPGSSLQDSSFKEIMQCSGTVQHMLIDHQDRLWICLFGQGVKVLDTRNGKPLHYYTSTSKGIQLSSNFSNNILQLNDSIFMIGADVLNVLNLKRGTNKLIQEWNGMPLGNILTFQKDDENNVWLSTENGIFKYNYFRDRIIKYSQWDGLITTANNEYVMESSLRMRNGNIAFIGNQNMFYFDPKQYTVAWPPPNVTISSFSLFHQFLPVDSLLQLRTVKLQTGQNSISISFASLSFRQIDKLEYYYQLEGADKDWVKSDQNLQAHYTLLPPGSYTFKVRAQNEEGIFSRDITELHIFIKPPFWRTWWFRSLAFIGVALFIYRLHRNRLNRLLHVEKVRIRLARDLHDDMGSTLSTINILSNMAMRKIDTDQATTREYIAKIMENSSRIMEAMDDIVWSINPLNDNMRKITARMKEFAGNVLESKDIVYNFTIDEQIKDLSLNMEWRREIFLLFKESINNIVKYAQCSRVDISMKLQNRYVELRIADNGIGFDPAKKVGENRGNGIKNMSKRAEAVRGKFIITSTLGKGTTVELKIPVK